MSLLKRHLAPFGSEVWAALEAEAAAVFKRSLTGRKIAEYENKGAKFAGANTGRVTALKERLGEAAVGVREVLRVVELKVPFVFKNADAELIERGAKTFDNGAIVGAARTLSDAENALVFDGFAFGGVKTGDGGKNGAISGIIPSAHAAHKPVLVKGDEILPAIAEGIGALKNAQIGGAYALIIQPHYYGKLFSAAGNGYPLTKKLTELLGGGAILASHALKSGALIVSLRGGDYEILGGEDISLGYEKAAADGSELYFYESLTFRVNTPEAAIALEWK